MNTPNKEDPIRETFPQLLTKAFCLGMRQYIPGEGDLGQAMMGALMEVMHWLHKEHRIYLLVTPSNFVIELRFNIEVIHYHENLDGRYIEHDRDDEYYQDWVEAHVEGLKVCLDYLEKNLPNESTFNG